MEEFLNSELAMTLATFIAGMLVTGITWGASALAKSFKESSNKLDDKLIPLMEAIAEIKEKLDK